MTDKTLNHLLDTYGHAYKDYWQGTAPLGKVDDAHQAIVKHVDALRADVARSQWIACKDQMPNNRGAATNVYLCWFQGRYAALEFDSQCGWCWGSGDMMLQRDQADVTHWQPLPDSPA